MISKIFPPIHTEGYKFLVIAAFVTIILLIINGFLGLIGLLLTVWVYYFFRDPERVIIEDDNYLVSPADGEVIKVEEVDGPKEVGLENPDDVSVDDFFDIQKNLWNMQGFEEYLMKTISICKAKQLDADAIS